MNKVLCNIFASYDVEIKNSNDGYIVIFKDKEVLKINKNKPLVEFLSLIKEKI